MQLSQRIDEEARVAPRADDRQRASVAQAEAKAPEPIALSDNMRGTQLTPVVRSNLEAPETTHQVTDLAAGAIGSVASYLADQLGELFAPTPPEVREAQAKADAKPDAAREAEKPEKEDKAAAYGRIIDNAVRMAEEERAREGDAYWKERDRGKGWERDQ